MKVSSIEIANVVIVVFLFFILTRKRDAVTLLLIVYVYSTLHFSFAVFALASTESSRYLVTLHNEGGGMLAKLSVLSLLGVVFFLLSRHAYNAFLLRRRGEQKVAFQIILVMVAVFCGYILNYRHGDWLQLKNVISFEAMLAFLLIGFFGVIREHTTNAVKIYSWGLGGLLILGIADFIAIYEVFYLQSWAGTLESSGAMVYRASSILFNPNLLSFWASLVYIGCAYGVHACKEHRKVMLWGMVLASIAIYMSGSRSAGYLLLGVLFISMLLIKGQFRWLVLVILPLTMLAIYGVARWFVAPFVSSNEGWYQVVLLGERFVAAPLHLINYVLMLVGAPVSVPAEVVLSIEGRFVSDGRDSGWMVLYQDVGWFGLVAVVFSCCMLVVQGVKAYITYPNPSAVYALAILFYCLLTGIVMRFQIFPVWSFVSLVLVVCLVFWCKLMPPNLHTRS